MASVGKISEFDVRSGDWSLYCDRLEMFFVVNGTHDDMRVPTLIAVVGEVAYELMVNLCSPVKPADKTYEQLVQIMKDHLQPTASVLGERFRFWQCRQRQGQSVAEFVTELKRLSRFCEFGTSLEDNLRDQFVCGLLRDSFRQRLFAEETVTYSVAVKIASTLEAAERDSVAKNVGLSISGSPAVISAGDSGRVSRDPRRFLSVGGEQLAGSLGGRGRGETGVDRGRNARVTGARSQGMVSRGGYTALRRQSTLSRAIFMNQQDKNKKYEEPVRQILLREYMPMVRVFLLTLLVGAVGTLFYQVYLKTPPLPDLDLDTWWGPHSAKTLQDTNIRPFRVKFTDAMIKDLRSRLSNHRPLTPPLEGVSMEYGMNTELLQKVLNYWSQDYSFSERETLLNSVPHFKTNIQGLDIHFIRVKPQAPPNVKIFPIILLHGWPGSVVEFYEAIPLLTSVDKERDFALELIVPSLPGYGFSSAAVRPGLGAAEVAVVMRNLMHRLGYKEYFVQGGDWGSFIGSHMATLFPDEVLGYHTNMPIVTTPLSNLITILGSFWPSLVVEKHLAERMYPLTKIYAETLNNTGYMHLQASKPDTIGVPLADSPAGLAAYIIEKFIGWTHPGSKALPSRPDLDSILDNLMVYWSTNSITTSMRLYAETFNKRHMAFNLDSIPTNVPTWAVQAKNELGYMPPTLLKFKYPNLLNTTVLEQGGHFLAMELPDIFAKDVLKSIQSFIEFNRKTRTEL